jgi:hypothetical protein
MNPEDLEKALNEQENSSENPQDNGNQKPQMSQEMEVGFHQGALNTLINERNELLKMVQITEQLMQSHAKRLEELGVKINFNSGQEEKK